MDEDKRVLKATHEGEIEISGFKIRSYNLENGDRVLSRPDFLRALGRTGKAKGGRAYDEGFKLPIFLTANNLKPYIPGSLLADSTPLFFKDTKGKVVIGHKAELLPSVCYVFMDANEAGALQKNQEHIAQRGKLLVRGFATIGIIALVDEATGYQAVRDREALKNILDKYINDEYASWTKTFPDEFYKNLFRLKNMDYRSVSGRKPMYVGMWTNDVVYKRLAPAVLTALKEKNPKNERGNRSHKLHQSLTLFYGHPKLKEHLTNVIFLMKGCTRWNDFERLLNRASPRFGDTIPLDLPAVNDEVE